MLKLTDTFMKLGKDLFKIHEPYTLKEKSVFGEMEQELSACMTEKKYSFKNVMAKMIELKKDIMEDSAITLSTVKLSNLVDKFRKTAVPYYDDLAKWEKAAYSKTFSLVADVMKKLGPENYITASGKEIHGYVTKVSDEMVTSLKEDGILPKSHYVEVDKINQLIADKITYDLVKSCDIDALPQAAEETANVQALVPNLS